LQKLGRSSITTREEVRKRDGELSAEAESVIVARDPETQRSRPLTPEELEAFARLAPA
jgi:acyl-CoA thioesterase FadM